MKTLFLYLMLFIVYPGKRQVLIFFNEDGTATKEKQLAMLKKNASGLKERDIAIQTFLTTAPASKDEVQKWQIDASKPFTVILIGKDGGEKLRSDSVLPATKFFTTIDAMPMRKDEMNN